MNAEDKMDLLLLSVVFRRALSPASYCLWVKVSLIFYFKGPRTQDLARNFFAHFTFVCKQAAQCGATAGWPADRKGKCAQIV